MGLMTPQSDGFAKQTLREKGSFGLGQENWWGVADRRNSRVWGCVGGSSRRRLAGDTNPPTKVCGKA